MKLLCVLLDRDIVNAVILYTRNYEGIYYDGETILSTTSI